MSSEKSRLVFLYLILFVDQRAQLKRYRFEEGQGSYSEQSKLIKKIQLNKLKLLTQQCEIGTPDESGLEGGIRVTVIITVTGLEIL